MKHILHEDIMEIIREYQKGCFHEIGCIEVIIEDLMEENRLAFGFNKRKAGYPWGKIREDIYK